MDITHYYRRVFLAITVPDEVCGMTAGIYHQLHHETGYEQLRWVKPSLQHITLQFLGGVEGGSLIALSESLMPKLAKIKPFALELGPLRLFPNLRKAHCLILRVNLSEALQSVVESVHASVNQCGIDGDDKPFRPHLTLARIPPKIRRLRRPELVLPEMSMPVTSIALMNSIPEGNTVHYETIAQFQLGAVIDDEYDFEEEEDSFLFVGFNHGE